MRLQKTASLLKAHIFIKLRNKTKKRTHGSVYAFSRRKRFFRVFRDEKGRKS